jgi:hypothetical protein
MSDLRRMLRDKERDAAAAEERLQALTRQQAELAAAREAARRDCEELQRRQEELRRRGAAAALERCVCFSCWPHCCILQGARAPSSHRHAVHNDPNPPNPLSPGTKPSSQPRPSSASPAATKTSNWAATSPSLQPPLLQPPRRPTTLQPRRPPTVRPPSRRSRRHRRPASWTGR